MNYEPITAADERALIQRAQAGDRRAADRLIRAYEPLAGSMAAKRHAGTGMDYDDLFQTAQLAMVEALKLFELSRGVRFGTYARSVINSALTEAVGQSMSTIYMPKTARQKAHKGTLSGEAREAFDRAQLPAVEVDERTQTDNAEVELFQLIHGRQTAARVREAVATLEDRERNIVEQTMLADPARTLQSLGDELQISKARVGQIRDDAYGRLRKRLRGLGG